MITVNRNAERIGGPSYRNGRPRWYYDGDDDDDVVLPSVRA